MECPRMLWKVLCLLDICAFLQETATLTHAFVLWCHIHIKIVLVLASQQIQSYTETHRSGSSQYAGSDAAVGERVFACAKS
jgi:hypothetical protein